MQPWITWGVSLKPSGRFGAYATEPTCSTPPALLSIEPTLTYVAAKLAKRETLTILAMGSSSTEGIGASSPAATYPSRLEAELHRRFPDRDHTAFSRPPSSSSNWIASRSS